MTTDAPAPPCPPDAGAYRLLLDEVGAFVYTADLNGRYTYANRLVLEMLGHPLEDVIGKDFAHFFGKGDLDDSLDDTDRRVMRDGETVEREECHQLPGSDEARTFWSVKKPLRDRSGRIIGLLGISYDITDKVRLEARLREQKALLDTVLDNIDALVYMKGADRRFLYANRKLAEAFGCAAKDIVGHRDTEFMPADVADRFWQLDQRILRDRLRYSGEESMLDAAGQRHHYWSVIVPWADANGAPAVIGMSTDITELHALKEELQRQARTDSLTGIANRRSFFELAEREFARSRRHGAPLSLIAADIDHFKRINDSYGHPTGDFVLQEFAGCCQGILREVDVFARTGGEEFCILLPDTALDAAHATAERMRTMTAACHPSDEHPELQITASFGVSCLTAEDMDFHALFARADRALYVAKDRGRNCTAVLSDA